MLAWIQIQIDKWRTGNELTQWGSKYANFYVLYPDGRKSVSMYYHAACDYAEIFCGQVFHEPTGKRLV